MILCDIGNTNGDFYQDGKVWSMPISQLREYSSSEKVFYINVNENLKGMLKQKHNFIDLEPFFELDTIYQGMGIDRVAACYTVSDGMIVDAGSAITVDIMSGGVHLGGFILPGLDAFEKCYAAISPRLALKINPSITTDTLPQKTNDAISYGAVKSIITLLEGTCKDKRIFFTGGDGKFFSKFFNNAIFDRTLIFRGMLRAIKEAHLG